MKKLMRSPTKAQQAPTSGRSGVARQSARPVPCHTASMSRNFKSGGTTQTTKSSANDGQDDVEGA